MSSSGTLKLFLKRGALVCAANWPVVLVQFTADALFKTLVAIPVAGGALLVVLLIGGSPSALFQLEPREVVPALASILMALPLALAAFLGALGVVIAGGSVLMCAVKAGTVAVLVAGEDAAGAIELPPLRAQAIRQAAQFSVERFIGGVRGLFPRYVALGVLLGLVYAVSMLAYLLAVFGPTTAPVIESPVAAVVAALALIAWLALVNALYMLCQIVICAHECTVREAAARVTRLLSREVGPLAGIFGAILVLMTLTVAASILAIAALGLISFVPLVGLVAVPLQVCAWLVRGVVFQFISLSGLAAYVRVIRLATTDGRHSRTGLGAGHAAAL